MAVYQAKDANGEVVNLVEIDPGQIEGWQKLTGLKLELPAESEPDPAAEGPNQPDLTTMEAALKELGVKTRE